ncbi:lytic transglycosylase [Mesorhizobium sp. Root157]|uniref:lytic murein transglycosylase n=1 Tax=Mesorhizobium sp. Root157 TaxID=1736477 RepID=UPI0006FE1569|nr:lytic murein transglycosylase [Mesorhizobium sp. Root157]KRA00345.1 lytic transglycosylase [Mesorhizobium sp. Root157]
MAVLAKGRVFAAATLAALMMATGAQAAGQCGKDGSGFAAWTEAYKADAQARGIDTRPMQGVKYDTGVIKIDRSQHKAFKGTVEQFLARRAPASYVSKAKGYMKSQAGLLRKIEAQFGVQPEVLLAIWGMETGFGANSGNKSVFGPLATLAYDCRRSEFFTNELDSALEIAQKGYISAAQMRGAGFGELGQTQFLPSKYLQFAVDFDGDGRRDLIHSRADVLASTANFLRGHGWSAGGGYRPGEANYGVWNDWNRATIYQKALAEFAHRIAN